MGSEPSSPGSASGGRRRGIKLAAGLALSAAFLYATLSMISVDQLAAILSRADPAWLAVALACIAFDYVVKIVRWRTMLVGLGAHVEVGAAAVPFMGCVALNNVLPFRAGDMLRVVAFQRTTGLPTSAQLSTLLLERLLDLLVLITILLAALALWPAAGLPEVIAQGATLAAGAIVLALVLFFTMPAAIVWAAGRLEARWSRLRPVTALVTQLSGAVSSLSSPLLLGRLLAMSVVAWLAEGAAFFAVGQALGLSLSGAAVLLALSLGTLSTIIPSSPGYVGTFHYFTALALTTFGIAAAESTAFAVAIHGLLWASTTACGLLLLASVRLRSAREPVPLPHTNP